MNTLKLTDDNIGISTAAEILKDGGIVAIPTETVYGLAASAFDDEAIKKVFAAKGRPQDNPLIVHIADMAMLNEISENLPPEALKLADAFWPGPLTMVVPKSPKIAKSVSCGLETVAVRMPSNAVARKIINESGLPLAAPSANLSGSPSPTSAKHVISDLDGKIDAVVISGDCSVGVESTVISLVCNPPSLLRPGAVTFEQLKMYIPSVTMDKAVLSEPEKGEKVASPGMKYKHYAPKTEVFLVEGSSDAFAELVNSHDNVAAICFSEDVKKIKTATLCYGDAFDAEEQARSIFSLLRKTDEMNFSAVYIHAPQKNGVGLAVYNRLIRAAAFKVIKL